MEIGQVAATNAVIRPYENPDGGMSIRNVVGIIFPLPHPSWNMVGGGAAAPPASFSVYGPGNENEVFVSFSRNPVQVFQNILNNKWINKNNTLVDRQRTCDSYLPNSLRPIAYLGFRLCFRPEIHFFFCKNQPTKSLVENTQNALTFFGSICLPKPKSLGFSKKVLFVCPSMQVVLSWT